MENNIRFRNHISVIFEKVIKVAGIAIFIFATNFITDLEEAPTVKDLLIFLGVAVACILLVFVWQCLIWSRTYISIQDNALVIEKNTLNRKKNTIGIPNISNVNLEQNLLEMALGTCKLKLDTNTLTTADQTDVNIVLKKQEAERFRMYLLGLCKTEEIEEAKSEEKNCAATSKEILMHGLFSINLGSILLLLGVIGSVMPLIKEMGAAEEASMFEFVLSILVIIWFVGGMVWKIAREFLRYLEFSIERRGDKVFLSYGIIKRVNYSIPVDKINAVRLNQTMLARMGKRYMVEVVNVGMGNDEEEQHSFFLPYSRKEKIAEQLEVLLPEFQIEFGEEGEGQGKGVFAVWAANGLMWLAILIPILAVAAEILDTGVVMVIVVALVLMLYIVILRYTSYVTDKIFLGDKFMQISQGHFARYHLFVKYEKIQYLTLKQCIVAKKYGIQKGQLYLLASAKNKVHNLPYMRQETMETLIHKVR